MHPPGHRIRARNLVSATLEDHGVDTIVDATVVGLGRDVARVARVDEQVDLDIVACTGFYTLMRLWINGIA
jgi:predicted metal-dependent phosphotriesterase family hydrolase